MRTVTRIITGFFLATSALISIPLAAHADCKDTQTAKVQQTAKGMRGPEGIKGEAGVAGGQPSMSDNDSVASPTTTFIDGPTGYVFVYTVEGWKFAGNTKK
jgi:hypothetical protein